MIEKGIEWLDTKIPNWKSRINPETLDIRYWGKCVLGQAVGIANVFTIEDIKKPNFLQEHGFFAVHGEHEALNEAWKQYLVNK